MPNLGAAPHDWGFAKKVEFSFVRFIRRIYSYTENPYTVLANPMVHIHGSGQFYTCVYPLCAYLTKEGLLYVYGIVWCV